MVHLRNAPHEKAEGRISELAAVVLRAAQLDGQHPFKRRVIFPRERNVVRQLVNRRNVAVLVDILIDLRPVVVEVVARFERLALAPFEHRVRELRNDAPLLLASVVEEFYKSAQFAPRALKEQNIARVPELLRLRLAYKIQLLSHLRHGGLAFERRGYRAELFLRAPERRRLFHLRQNQAVDEIIEPLRKLVLLVGLYKRSDVLQQLALIRFADMFEGFGALEFLHPLPVQADAHKFGVQRIDLRAALLRKPAPPVLKILSRVSAVLQGRGEFHAPAEDALG